MWKRGLYGSGAVQAGYFARIAVFTAFVVLGAGDRIDQELGGAGTLQGTVKDPTGGVMVAVTVNLAQPVSGLRRTTTTDSMGRFAFRNLPQNPYHLEVMAQGFQTLQRDVDVRSGVPIDLDLSLALAGARSPSVSSDTLGTCSSVTRPRTPTSTRA